MKAIGVIIKTLLLFPLLAESGCEPTAAELPTMSSRSSNVPSVYALYTAAKIDIIPLTEFSRPGEGKKASKINVYVSLLDSLDCQIKTPGVFRFELYELVQRSAEPKGKRIVIWPDIDLTDAVENSNYWRDYLRAYEFNLDFEPARNQNYILQVTCLCPNGKRLSANFALKYTE
jgi:hypothetical protein